MRSYASVDHLARASELERLGKYDLALQEVRRALEQDPHLADAHAEGAWVLFRMKRFDRAEEAARAALALDPEMPSAWNSLACVLWAKARPLEAENAFKTMLAYPDPDKALHLTNYARFLAADERPKEALVIAEQALSLAPVFDIAHEVRGIALQGLGRNEEAEESFRRALHLDPTNAEAHNGLGEVQLAKGEVDAALGSFREALRLKPGDDDIQKNLTEALKARHPGYGRLLSLTLRGNTPRGKLFMNVIGVGFLAALFLPFIVLGALDGWRSPSTPWMFHMAVLLMVLIGLAFFVVIGWRRLAGPVFNTLLLFDPLGRNAVQYQSADRLGVGMLVITVLCFLAFLVALPLFGSVHPAPRVALLLCLVGTGSLLLLGNVREAYPRWKRMTWIGFALVALGLYGAAISLGFLQIGPALLFGLVAFAGGVVSYLAWLFNQTRIDEAEPSAKRSMARKVAIWVGFGLVGLAVGIYVRARYGGAGTAGFFWAGVYIGEIVQILVWPEDNASRNFTLYRRWAIHYGEEGARWRWLLMMAAILVGFGALALFLAVRRGS